MSSHTATPWEVEYRDNGSVVIRGPISQNVNKTLVRVASLGSPGQTSGEMFDRNMANAALIVRAVNSHEALVEALERARIKLSRYKEYHPETYIGGVLAEYEATIKTIDAALSQARP